MLSVIRTGKKETTYDYMNRFATVIQKIDDIQEEAVQMTLNNDLRPTLFTIDLYEIMHISHIPWSGPKE